MRPSLWVVCFSAAVLLCSGQQNDEDSRLALLIRVRARMRTATARMPDFACIENITRTVTATKPSRTEYVDRVRLEVGFVRGREVFSWPGSNPFARQDPIDIVGEGTIGSGDFAGFNLAVFVAEETSYGPGQEDVLAGRKLIRYEYHVPAGQSGYTVRSATGQAIVPYRGFFWVDPQTERVVAVEIFANEIPHAVDVSEIHTLLEYKPLRLGEEEFSFPAASEITAKFHDKLIRNRIEISGCRQYQGESALTFGDAPDKPEPAAQSRPPESLPPGITLRIALEKPVDSETAAAGDLVSAIVQAAADAGTLKIPKGARLSGRIARLQLYPRIMLALDFFAIEIGNARYDFRSRLQSHDRIRGVAGQSMGSMLKVTGRDLDVASAQGARNLAVFEKLGPPMRLPAGFGMQLETTAPDVVETKPPIRF